MSIGRLRSDGRAIVCLVTDRQRSAAESTSDAAACEALVALAVDARQAGIDLIQVRERGLTDRALLGLVERMVAATDGSDTRVVVNDRIDIALAAGADGVHLTSSAPPASRVRPVAAASWVIGRSVHRLDEARRVEAAGGLDYLVCGTVFETQSKPGQRPLGIAGLAAVTGGVVLPVLAIGGISVTNASSVAGAGAAGIAAIGLFADVAGGGAQHDLCGCVGALRDAFDKGRGLV